eukprot:1183645-Prorocentrum_minimum.AAC.1
MGRPPANWLPPVPPPHCAAITHTNVRSVSYYVRTVTLPHPPLLWPEVGTVTITPIECQHET